MQLWDWHKVLNYTGLVQQLWQVLFVCVASLQQARGASREGGGEGNGQPRDKCWDHGVSEREERLPHTDCQSQVRVEPQSLFSPFSLCHRLCQHPTIHSVTRFDKLMAQLHLGWHLGGSHCLPSQPFGLACHAWLCTYTHTPNQT